MERHFDLLKNIKTPASKRVFPRFPFCYLIFQADKGCEKHRFEVIEISWSGMQLQLKDGEHEIKNSGDISGQIHWRGDEIEVKGKVKWTFDNRIGVAFSQATTDQSKLQKFFSIENFAQQMKSLHDADLDLEIPSNLKYWLRADGPCELFVWQHSDGEISKFQLILMDRFMEWVDGEGLGTGKILTKRDVDTPLISEDEFFFEEDRHIDEDLREAFEQLLNAIPAETFSEDKLKFIKRKVHHR